MTCLIAFAQKDIPFKPGSEFEVKIELSFKLRGAEDSNTFKSADNSDFKKNTSGVIPFLIVNLKLIEVGEAIKIKIRHGLQDKTSKIKNGSAIKLDLGFIEDIKSQAVPNELIVLFIDNQKKEISKVILYVDEDGNFLVNGEKRGKF